MMEHIDVGGMSVAVDTPNIRAMANALVDEADRLIANIDLARREALTLRSDINRILEAINGGQKCA